MGNLIQAAQLIDAARLYAQLLAVVCETTDMENFSVAQVSALRTSEEMRFVPARHVDLPHWIKLAMPSVREDVFQQNQRLAFARFPTNSPRPLLTVRASPLG